MDLSQISKNIVAISEVDKLSLARCSAHKSKWCATSAVGMGDSLGVTNQMGIAIQRGESDHINGFHQSTKFNLSASKRPMASAQVDITNFSDKTRSPNRQHEKSHQSSQSEEVITRGSSSDGQIGPRGLAGQNRELVWEKFGKRNLHSRRTGIVTRHDRHKGYPPSGQ